MKGTERGKGWKDISGREGGMKRREMEKGWRKISGKERERGDERDGVGERMEGGIMERERQSVREREGEKVEGSFREREREGMKWKMREIYLLLPPHTQVCSYIFVGILHSFLWGKLNMATVTPNLTHKQPNKIQDFWHFSFFDFIHIFS